MTAVHAFTDQNELVEKLRADAKPGDALLFKGSRACAWSAHSHCF